MPRDARILSKWRVFVDGVEIPHLGLSLTFGRNQYGNGTIMVEPDALLHDFRPNSIVSVWFFDQYGSSPLVAMPDQPHDNGATPPVATGDIDDLLENYRLYFVGELTGISHTKSPQSRTMALQVSGLIRIMQRHKMFASSIGGSYTTPIFTGGIMIPAALVDTDRGDALSLTMLSELYFDPESSALNARTDEEVALCRTSKTPDFAERIISMAAFLSSFNGSLRLAMVRTRLLNTLAGLPDTTLRNLVGVTVASKVLADSQGKVSADWSLLDTLTFFCSKVFYSWYHIPGPYTPPDGYVLVTDPETGEFIRARGQPQKPEDIKIPTETLGVDEGQDITRQIFSIKRDFYRNDYLFLPELYFAFPPPCNFLFPEDIDGITYQRQFDREPTRFVLVEPYFTEGKAMYVAPPWLLRQLAPDEQRNIKSPAFFTGNVDGIVGSKAVGAEDGRPKYKLKSPYISPGEEEGQDINLLSVMSDDEIEKGIIASTSYNPFEIMSAVARYKQSYGDDTEPPDPESGNEAELIGDDYTKYMNNVAMYRYMMERSQRDAQVTCTGHKWIVPGFNALICDKDSVYMGFVESVTQSVDVNSSVERTSIILSKVRHIPYQPTKMPRVDLIQQNREFRDTKKKDLNFIKETYRKILNDVGKAVDDILYGLGRVRTEPTITPRDHSSRSSRTGLDLVNDGITVLNGYAATISNTLFGGVRTESGERFISARPEWDSLDASSGIDISTIEGYEDSEIADPLQRQKTALTEYTDSTCFPVFPLNWQASKYYSTAAMVFNHEAIAYQAKTLGDRIKDYVRFQLAELDRASKTNAPFEIDDLGNQMIAQRLGAITFDYRNPATQYEIAQAMDMFVPPAWFNQGFLRLSTIDELYKNLLGCQPFYSIYGKSTSKGARKLTDEEMYHEYVGFLQALDKVFPFLTPDGIIPSARAVGEKSEWERLSEADDLAPNPHIWMTQHIQRREVTTMKQFLKQHGLKLVRSMSYDPTPTVFYEMVPESLPMPTVHCAGQVGGYPYDNSLFSMIVDEWEMFSNGGVQDPAIVKLRDESRNPALSRVKRQEIVRAYSQKHFGARGFDGR